MLDHRNATNETIDLDSLCLFCRSNDLAIRFGSGEERDWVSPFGVVPQKDGDAGEVAERLKASLNFEIFPMNQGREVCYFLTRQELEEQLLDLMN